MNLNEASRALLRDCERLARRATGNEYAEAHVNLWPDGVFAAVALDLGGLVWRAPAEPVPTELRATFAEGYGKTPEEALHQLERALRREIAESVWPSSPTRRVEALDSESERTH